ncbi:hypothetical protein BR93DRAFT_970147 [Coniochaeta sp. PMI_546]|nr:hypothetical protein BR93DRAFT_970147 [Coniochaeta sp. PMI_546]
MAARRPRVTPNILSSLTGLPSTEAVATVILLNSKCSINKLLLNDRAAVVAAAAACKAVWLPSAVALYVRRVANAALTVASAQRNAARRRTTCPYFDNI